MTDSELTVSILREIRDSIRTLDTNLSGRIDGLQRTFTARIEGLETSLSTRIDQTNARIDQTNERLGFVEGTLRDAAAQILLLGRYLKNRTEVDLQDLRVRVERLETKLGG